MGKMPDTPGLSREQLPAEMVTVHLFACENIPTSSKQTEQIIAVVRDQMKQCATLHTYSHQMHMNATNFGCEISCIFTDGAEIRVSIHGLLKSREVVVTMIEVGNVACMRMIFDILVKRLHPKPFPYPFNDSEKTM